MGRDIILGIDFGTSYTSAGALVDGRVELVLDNGDATIPSVVHIPDRGPPVVGRPAVHQLAVQPGCTVASVKRIMGADADGLRRLAPTASYRMVPTPAGGVVLKLRNQDWAVEQIAAALLDHIRNLAERRFGARISKAVITASAVATPAYQASLRKAARLAHLEVLEIVAEPIAGALALGLREHDTPRRLLVCDFGGGTFDVTAIVQHGRRFRSIAIGGDPFLGGDDLDQAMVNAIAGLIYKRARYDLLHDAVRRQLLTLRCESVKRSLSSAMEARLSMKEAYIEDSASRDVNVVLERSWVEPLWEPLFGRALGAVDDTLARAGWQSEQVDAVAMIGGTSLVPRFQQLVGNRFARVDTSAREVADVAVAMGATLLTARHLTSRPDVPVLDNNVTA